MGPGTLPLIVAVITCGPCWLVWAVHYLCGGASCTILIKAVMANMASRLVFLHASGIKPSISFACLEDSELQQLYSSVEFSCAHPWNINTADKHSMDTNIAMQLSTPAVTQTATYRLIGRDFQMDFQLHRCSRISPDHWLRQSGTSLDTGSAAELCLRKLTDQSTAEVFAMQSL